MPGNFREAGRIAKFKLKLFALLPGRFVPYSEDTGRDPDQPTN